jgi:hypothetical protein
MQIYKTYVKKEIIFATKIAKAEKGQEQIFLGFLLCC